MKTSSPPGQIQIERGDFDTLFRFLDTYHDYFADDSYTPELYERYTRAHSEARKVLTRIGTGVFLADSFISQVTPGGTLQVTLGIPASDLIRYRYTVE
jgi:hypothetical protein